MGRWIEAKICSSTHTAGGRGLGTPLCCPVPAVAITNLVCNLLFFLSHLIFTPYYLMPIAMLSLWSLLFLELMDGRALSEDVSDTFQPHTAQS